MGTERPVILLVEDNLADVRLMREAMREHGLGADLEVAGNGDDALAVMQRDGDAVSAPPIGLVILDLNLPRKSGLEVLCDMRRDPRLDAIPVIVLTTSTSEADVTDAYRRGANCYIVKPVDFEEFRRVVAAIDRFWFGIARIPTRSPT